MDKIVFLISAIILVMLGFVLFVRGLEIIDNKIIMGIIQIIGGMFLGVISIICTMKFNNWDSYEL